MTDIPDTPHPAKFSAPILEVIDSILVDLDFPDTGTILDPFAGVGGIHTLGDGAWNTFGVEIEPEWAAQSARLGPTWCGDFFKLPIKPYYDAQIEAMWTAGYNWPGTWDAVITSPTYANRMADNHNAQERCKVCMATGIVSATRAEELVGTKAQQQPGKCIPCDGQGHRVYKRMTYRHQLGRTLSDNNSGGLPWGVGYRWFHQKAWKRVVTECLSSVGEELFILNVKNHIRLNRVVDVVGWHRNYITKRLGIVLIADHEVDAKGMRMGENHEARVDHEHVMVFKGFRED